MGVCCPFLQPWDRARDQCLLNLPCLSDPVRRSSLLLKLALVALHLVFIGFLFLFDAEFIEKTKRDPWYMGCYILLFSATLLQYFVTSGSSPGYVVDAMRDVCEASAMYRNPSTTSIDNMLPEKVRALLLMSKEDQPHVPEGLQRPGGSWFWTCTLQGHPLEI